MLLPSSQLLDMPVMSLQTGREVARTTKLIIDPKNLHIIAYEVIGQHLDNVPSFLRIQDIRELSDIGFIIDSSDEFVALDDIINLKKIYELDFVLEGMKIVDETQQKLGKISATVTNAESFVVEQLNVRRPLLKSFNDTELLIHRTQILDITKDTVIVRRASVEAKSQKVAKETFMNPFRGTMTSQRETMPKSLDRR